MCSSAVNAHVVIIDEHEFCGNHRVLAALRATRTCRGGEGQNKTPLSYFNDNRQVILTWNRSRSSSWILIASLVVAFHH
jgi:hypothetical protein